MFVLPHVLMCIINGLVSSRRLSAFFAAPEIENMKDYHPGMHGVQSEVMGLNF